MVEEDDVVMAEMTLEAQRATGEIMRAAMGEVFVFRAARSRSGAPTWSRARGERLQVTVRGMRR